MRTGDEIAGLAIVSEGERIGRVHDVVFEPGSKHITGFLVDPGGVFARPKFLPRLMVRSLGADAVVVEANTALEERKVVEEAVEAITAHSIRDRPVIDETGKLLGKVADVVVDEATLTISALVVASGFLDNLVHGKPRLPMELVRAFGSDSIIAASEFDPHAAAMQAGADKA